MLSRSTRHLRSARRALLIAGIGITLGACAQGGASLAPQIGQKVPDSYNPGQPYQLSREELSLDCRKLTGRMQVRILQVRDSSVRGGTTAMAQTTQSLVTPLMGGTTRRRSGGRRRRDRAYLEAMNKLAAQNAPRSTSEAELQPPVDPRYADPGPQAVGRLPLLGPVAYGLDAIHPDRAGMPRNAHDTADAAGGRRKHRRSRPATWKTSTAARSGGTNGARPLRKRRDRRGAAG
jgi:hypothetical protein